MSLWAVQTRTFPVELFKSLTPKEVLFEFDAPLTFTFAGDSVLFLAHFVNDHRGLSRYIVSPTTDEIVGSLKNGALSLRGAICQPIMWIVDCRDGWTPASAWISSPSSLPEGAIPDEGVMLTPALEPLLRMRVTGRDIREGSVEADMIRRSVARVQLAFRRLAAFVQSGRMVSRSSSRKVVFVKESRKRINAGLKSLGGKNYLVFEEEGQIEELDIGRFTFTLRKIEGSREQKCRYRQEHATTVESAFHDRRAVLVIGTMTSGSPTVETVKVEEI